MESGLMLVLIVLVLVLSVGVLYLLSVQLRAPRHDLQATALVERLSQQHAQAAVMAEKLAQLEPVSQAVTRIQLGLTELQTYAKARQDLERQTAESIRRLETVIAGTQTKGAAGENILEVVFAKLPPDWQVRNLRIGNKAVEFGLRLPNGLVLPIDSKWTATNLVEQFAMSSDPVEQQRLKAQIEATVLERAREVRKYIDPNITVSFGIAAVPDAVFDLCTGIHCDAFQSNVVLISYSMFVPYLLLVFQTVMKTSSSVDIQKLNGYLLSVQDSMKSLQGELEGRFAKALTMLVNSRNDMSVHVSKISGGLSNLQMAASTPDRPALAESAAAPE